MTAPEFDTNFRARLSDLLTWRRDVRHFCDRPLPDGLIDELLATACLAPSVGNSQPWRFVRIQSPALRASLADCVDLEKTRSAEIYSGDARRDYDALKLHGLREAPEILAIFCDMSVAEGRGLGRQTMPETLNHSVILAIHTLWLAARAHGVGVGWVSLIEPFAVRAMLNVPDSWNFTALLCLGWPQTTADIPELEQRGWQVRNPANTMIFTQ